MNNITLTRTPDAWVAEFTGSLYAECLRSFGTNVIATGFAAGAEPTDVLAEMSKLNPDALVEIAPIQ